MDASSGQELVKGAKGGARAQHWQRGCGVATIGAANKYGNTSGSSTTITAQTTACLRLTRTLAGLPLAYDAPVNPRGQEHSSRLDQGTMLAISLLIAITPTLELARIPAARFKLGPAKHAHTLPLKHVLQRN